MSNELITYSSGSLYTILSGAVSGEDDCKGSRSRIWTYLFHSHYPVESTTGVPLYHAEVKFKKKDHSQ